MNTTYVYASLDNTSYIVHMPTSIVIERTLLNEIKSDVFYYLESCASFKLFNLYVGTLQHKQVHFSPMRPLTFCRGAQ